MECLKIKSWSCGAPATTIPNALRPKEKDIFDVNSENFRHNNANDRFFVTKLHTVALYFITSGALSGNWMV